MKISRTLPLASLLLLAACSSGSTGSSTLDDKLKNPLYAQKYYEDLVDHMVSLEIHNDPVLKINGVQAAVDYARTEDVKLAQDAAKLKSQGLRGVIVSDTAESEGSALLVNGVLYFGPDFYVSPSPSVHVFLSNVVDPRPVKFPDATAVDLGVIQDPYGAQSFTLPETQNTTQQTPKRTLVIFDTKIQKLLGFVQLSGN
jgi:hypothetical protein